MTGYIDFLNGFDRFILCVGFLIILLQGILFVGYILKVATLERTAITWLNWLHELCELFPLLGLLGTVGGLLNTFKNVQLNAEKGFDIGSMLGDFAPALTSTVSGIVALMLNLVVYLFLIKIIEVIEEGEVRR